MELFKNNKFEGKFIKRINRFIAEIEIDGEIHQVHVPNTGRMKELLIEGARVMLKYHPAPHKKTSYTLISVEKDGIFVCIDSTTANRLFYDYLANGKLEEFSNIKDLKREVKYGNSRFDIGFIQNNQQVLIEIKSVNLVKNTHAMFPDAPTSRGNKHVQELIKAKSMGIKTAVVFIIQRCDATSFSPHWEMDPIFSNSLLEAYSKGVMIKAFCCSVDDKSIDISHEIPIFL